MSDTPYIYLSKLLFDYESKTIDALRLSTGLQQVYREIDFKSDEEKRIFFDTVFEVEQVVASHIDSLEYLGQHNFDIINSAIRILKTFRNPKDDDDSALT